jgi:hypothetical protein
MEMQLPVSVARRGWTAVAAIALAAAPVALSPTATADDVPLHHVRYTVTTETPFFADIYYRDVDPPDWAAYSHDPYSFSPKVQAQVGPGQPWVMDVMLADPSQWAMVVATSGQHLVEPNFHCTLEVDGKVVSTKDGPKGALCSIRLW